MCMKLKLAVFKNMAAVVIGIISVSSWAVQAASVEPKKYGSAEETLRYQSWVQSMKTADRGPFSQIRWFCKDGSVLPPTPYACKDLGGGRQHGEWTAKTKTLRENGFLIANVSGFSRPQRAR